MNRPLAVFFRKPSPAVGDSSDDPGAPSSHSARHRSASRRHPAVRGTPEAGQAPEGADRPQLLLELEHRVWLARFGDGAPDPGDYAWDGYEPELCLPDLWQDDPTDRLLATTAFGGPFTPDGLGARPVGDLGAGIGSGPVPGDRVVAYRLATDDVVGVWLVTGLRSLEGGEVRLGLRPLVSVTEPVPLSPDRSIDADLAQCLDQWSSSPAASDAAADVRLVDGPGLAGLIRTIGIDPALLCGPVEELPDCSLSNRRLDDSTRPRSRLAVQDSAEAAADRLALGEAVDWITRLGCPSLVSPFQDRATDVETVNLGGGRGWCLVARNSSEGPAGVQELVAVGSLGADLDEIELCPSVVHEAELAASEGRNWALVVTLAGGAEPQSLWLDAQAVALCFDRFSGRLAPI